MYLAAARMGASHVARPLKLGADADAGADSRIVEVA